MPNKSVMALEWIVAGYLAFAAAFYLWMRSAAVAFDEEAWLGARPPLRLESGGSEDVATRRAA